MNYIYKKIDIEMALSSLIFLIPGILHYYENEKLEAISYVSVTVSSILSDAIDVNDQYYTTTVDRIVAPCALIVAMWRAWILRPYFKHRLYLLISIGIAIICLGQGRNARHIGNYNLYRSKHIQWHLMLFGIGTISVLYR